MTTEECAALEMPYYKHLPFMVCWGVVSLMAL